MAFLRRVGTAATVIASLVAWLGEWHSGWAAPASGAGKKPAASACDRPAFRVLVDVGHTAESPGAISARGIYEYDFNLRLASVIEQDLLQAGFGNTVLLVTDGPARKSLVDRVAHANRLSPDLFLSIPHDCVPDSFLA